MGVNHPAVTMSAENHQPIVDLLLLAVYQDDHLSIEEDSMLKKALHALGWQENEHSGPKVGEAFAAVRKANASELAREEFLKDRTSRIKEAGTSSLALDWLGRILGSDGLDRSESQFLARVEKMMF